MKVRSLFFLTLLAAGVLSACSGKKDGHDEHGHDHEHEHEVSKDEWKEMDDFHTLMADAFHPYKDSTNLEPAKTKAVALAAAADKWANAPLPEKVNNDEVKSKLETLKAGTASFVETVKSGDDRKIGDELTALHDQFHEIQEAWYGGGHGEHHH
jgi:ABC-type Zn2+ transport system substrate-binding protein/surface adhesin